MFDIAATATSTDRDLPDHKAPRSERTISIFVHGVLLENRLIQQAIHKSSISNGFGDLPDKKTTAAINIPMIARVIRTAKTRPFLCITWARCITAAQALLPLRGFHCAASELVGNNLVELRMNASSEVT
jgi:hypothetical protein